MHVGATTGPPRAAHRPLGGDDSLVRASLAVRSAALRVLEEHRHAMERAAALVRRSRALCAVPDALAAPLRSVRPPGAPDRAPAPRLEPRCTHDGCGEPAAFHPCFVFGAGERRVTLRAVPARVCAKHRADLDALFRRPAVVERLRAKLRSRGREVPGPLRVVFEVIA